MRSATFLTCSLLLATGGATLRAQEIQTLLARADVLCGRFDQAKSLVGLKHPVRSSGRFCIVAARGVLWETRQPFPSTVRLTRSEIVEFDSGRVTHRISAEQEPAVRTISDLLLALVGGDMTSLDRRFTVDATVQGAGWRARLTPRDETLKRVMTEILMSGGRYVSRVEIREAGGDRTEITFSELTTGAAAMTADEAKQLEASNGSAEP